MRFQSLLPVLSLICSLVNGQTLVPSSKAITPEAAIGGVIQPLNPQLATLPNWSAGQAVATTISPNGKTLLVLTSGYNSYIGTDGKALANEFVFVYDISQKNPAISQVLMIPNTFNGIAWNPSGNEFYVSGGQDDSVHIVGKRSDGSWAETASPISLGHKSALAAPGFSVKVLAAGLAVNGNGNRLVVANYENDSVSIIDLQARSVLAEVDLRPGAHDPVQAGTPGGEYLFWVAIKGDSKAYISSIRDREIVTLDISSALVTGRIPVRGQPNKMTLNKAQSLLYVAVDNTDSAAVINTSSDSIMETIDTIAPLSVYPGARLKGSNPNSVALSPDETVLYVTNGGSNSVAVIQLGQKYNTSQVVGLIPTGWNPTSVSPSQDGSTLYIVNGKTVPGPNMPPPTGNQYVWALTHAGLLTLPVPSRNDLTSMTLQVAANNSFPGQTDYVQSLQTMAALRQNIRHVIYIIKENRTYDQILGDLEVGNGDSTLAMFPEPITPNHHKLARQFVTVDNFYDSAESSGNGWNWSTAARATDIVDKTIPINYAGRGGAYDWEGDNRNVNVGLASVADRQLENALYPNDPNLLAGTFDVSAPDGPDGEIGQGYLWDDALRAGLTLRNYGFFVNVPTGADGKAAPISPQPYADGIVQASPAKAALQGVTDVYYRGYDQNNADYYLFKEWEREFDDFVVKNNLPNLTLVRLPHDHEGSFATALYGVNTPDTQTADNDYALGLFVQKVANSPYKNNTLIFVVEDDAQSGPDHVDAHRSVAYIVGPYVKQGAVVSKAYTTVNMIRTIKEALGITSGNFYDGLAEPMADVFDLNQANWSYTPVVPEVLRTTALPLPPRTQSLSLPLTQRVRSYAKPRHSAAYWQKKMENQDFSKEDQLDTEAYNRALWEGLMGKKRPYPTVRDGRDLRQNRQQVVGKEN